MQTKLIILLLINCIIDIRMFFYISRISFVVSRCHGRFSLEIDRDISDPDWTMIRPGALRPAKRTIGEKFQLLTLPRPHATVLINYKIAVMTNVSYVDREWTGAFVSPRKNTGFTRPKRRQFSQNSDIQKIRNFRRNDDWGRKIIPHFIDKIILHLRSVSILG